MSVMIYYKIIIIPIIYHFNHCFLKIIFIFGAYFSVEVYFDVDCGGPHVYVYCFSATICRYSIGFDETSLLMMIHLTRIDE